MVHLATLQKRHTVQKQDIYENYKEFYLHVPEVQQHKINRRISNSNELVKQSRRGICLDAATEDLEGVFLAVAGATA